MKTFDLFPRALAEAPSDVQAAFFNEFGAHLKTCCRGRHETQLCYLADELNADGRELVSNLHEFAELAANNRASLEISLSELRRQKSDLESEIQRLTYEAQPEEVAL